MRLEPSKTGEKTIDEKHRLTHATNELHHRHECDRVSCPRWTHYGLAGDAIACEGERLGAGMQTREKGSVNYVNHCDHVIHARVVPRIVGACALTCAWLSCLSALQMAVGMVLFAISMPEQSMVCMQSSWPIDEKRLLKAASGQTFSPSESEERE